MGAPRVADIFVLRVRREPAAGPEPPVERWQVEHVQTGLRVYVHGLDEAVAVIRSCVIPTHEPRLRRIRRKRGTTD
ncbi:MAG TPA: hypothetical protein VD902_01180 [Symbiobacteriaceae bacterium]|nr:hypothetical protein [Symbiobacteriaceae bacterium]